ncbi:23S rRNA (adenine(1618)-N(6))-methyltransferase RlmF [Shewanella acanthi]|uniref:23S rRNA (adenine(1618)-N(6))-methyltransferase RlmF n=1 Tax=Shewanella acanthi TaxID=2864212 RepID=UPI001C65A013|nr:23S rRNA (adenine(1618)-N(6))-methyltransferase RlmF [Shewanella acanthi]QYJ78966.1 23S rRNA (adenine(1618)-N(6))-methyltransferase RlmF [Shewanella acanthi]
MSKSAPKAPRPSSLTAGNKAKQMPKSKLKTQSHGQLKSASKTNANKKSKVTAKSAAQTGIKKALHPRNAHLHGYDFKALIQSVPKLKAFVRPTPYGALSIDFADPLAVKNLNTALLKHHYGIDYWDIPKGALCPPIPGRVDYLHYLADLLNEGRKTNAKNAVRALDIGTGANGIYAILGHQAYGWRFVASDINPASLANVQQIIDNNPKLQGAIELRRQRDEKAVFKGIVQTDDRFDLTLCNPPFHGSLEEASEGSQRKVRNLQLNRGEKASHAKVSLNFGGQAAELWCQGGERQFLATMIRESKAFSFQCLWFTSLVSKKENLKPCYQALAKLGADTVKTIEMHQGNKITRVLAWSFHSQVERDNWFKQ